MDISAIGRLLITFGIMIVVVGVILILVGKVPFLGRLPGDIVFRKDGFSIFFPLATMILVSLVLTLLANVLLRIFR